MVRRMLAVAVVVAALALGGCTSSDTPSGGLTATVASHETARKIADVVNQKMAEWNMRPVILKVTKGATRPSRGRRSARPWTASRPRRR